MIWDRNLDLHKEIKSTGKRISEGKKELSFSLFLLTFTLKDHWWSKAKIVSMYWVLITHIKVKYVTTITQRKVRRYWEYMIVRFSHYTQRSIILFEDRLYLIKFVYCKHLGNW